MDINWLQFMVGLEIGFILIIIPFSIFFALIVVKWMAEKNIFFTIAEEGTAKAIMWNGKFHKIVIKYRNHYITSDWDILNNPSISPPKEGIISKFLGGITWIGIPPFAEIYKYKFRWVTVKQSPEGEKHEAREKTIDYILLKQDIYFVKVTKAETQENMPVDVGLELTIEIVSPYKALFKTQNWLETIENQIAGEVREFIGELRFSELNEAKARSAEFYEKLREGRIRKFEEDYGVRIILIQIKSIDPAGELSKHFVEASTKEYVGEETAKAEIAIAKGKAKVITTLAEAKASAIIAEAKAEKERIEIVYGVIESDKVNLYVWDSIAKSNLTVLAGENVMPTISINPEAKVKKIITE